MENIKHVFFDLDNTLWDFRRNSKQALIDLYKKHKVAEVYGFSFEEFYPHYDVSNETLWTEFRDQKITKEQLRERRFKNAFKNLGINDNVLAYNFENEYIQTVTNHNFLVDGTNEILEYLSKKYTIHILTNGFQEVSERKINNSGLANKHKTLTTAEEVGFPKPDSRAFTAALTKANAKKEESIYIGDDWTADVFGATSFGIKVIFYNALHETPINEYNVPIISHLLEIKQYL